MGILVLIFHYFLVVTGLEDVAEATGLSEPSACSGLGWRAPAPHNDGMSAVESLKYCTPWGKIQIAVKNKNGTFTNLDIVPHDLLCELFPDFCTRVDGKPVMVEAGYEVSARLRFS